MTAAELFSHKRYFRICRPARVIVEGSEGAPPVRQTEHQTRTVQELPSEFHHVQWLPPELLTFQCGASDITMREIAASLPDHDVIGIDGASVACAHALAPQSDDQVLDLCVAPGGKAMLLSEFVDRVYGVDISRERLFVTRSLCKQHHYENISLILADGRVFNPLDQSTHSLRWRNVRKGSTEEKIPERFSKVLVDAQCTHDGSVKHISKFKDLDSYERKQAEGLIGLYDLQYDLLMNGWRLLDKDLPSARLIYSTCSFSEDQNDRIAERFLLSTPEAEIEAIDWLPGTPVIEKPIFKAPGGGGGFSAGCGYLFGMSFNGERVNDQTGGLFLIKFKVRNLSLKKLDLNLES